VLHGAEVTIPGRLPLVRPQLARVLRNARLVVAAGGYPAHEAERAARQPLPIVVVPPGVDVDRFRPLEPAERDRARDRLGVPPGSELVVCVSRLVPRKGMDTLIRASAEVAHHRPNLRVVIGGGRDSRRLQRLIDRTRAPVVLVGRVADDELAAVYGCGDLFAMLCRNRWGDLEQEGFGIVFLEGAACGVAQLAGRSGGSHEAVDHGVTGLIVDDPHSVSASAGALSWLLDDSSMREAMGQAARQRAVAEFTYDTLALQLLRAIEEAVRRQ
jgi:phosphatidylinositol alpha-1,6-mannosyltransferase